MFGTLGNVKPVLVDACFIAVLVLIITFGVLRGVKKTFIAALVFAISFFLGFCEWTNDLKTKYVLKNIDITEWLPAGATPVQKLYVSYLQNFFASLVVFLLFYIIINVIIILIGIIIRRRRGERANKPRAVSRIFGGLISLVYQGGILVLLLTCFNNKYTGMDKMFENTTVSKAILNFSGDNLNKIDEKLVSKMTLKVYRGDVLYEVSDEQMDSFEYVQNNADKIFNNQEYISVLEKTTTGSKELIKERIDDLYKLGIYSKYANTEKYFNATAEEWLIIMQKNFNSNSLQKIQYSAEEFILIKNTFVESGLETKFIDIYTNIAKGV